MEYKDAYVTKAVDYAERKINTELIIDLTNLLVLETNALFNKNLQGRIKNEKLRELVDFIYTHPKYKEVFAPQGELGTLSPVYIVLHLLANGQIEQDKDFREWPDYKLISDNDSFMGINPLGGALKCYLGSKDEIKPLEFNATAFVNDIVIDKKNETFTLNNALDYSKAMIKFVSSLKANKRFNENYACKM